jgi:hypothetical protein
MAQLPAMHRRHIRGAPAKDCCSVTHRYAAAQFKDAPLETEIERLTNFIAKHPHCPVCGNKDWQTTQTDGGPMVTKILSGPVLGPALNTYSIICNGCGTLRLISQGSVP